MFRDMMRKKQALTEAECREVLSSQLRGVLSLQGDDGYPYGVPINHWLDPETGHIFFHGGKTGHRVDAALRCEKVSFCVYDEGFRREGDWALNIRSVIVFGHLRPVTEESRAMEISRALSYKFTDDEKYIAEEILRAGPKTLCWELIPEHMTGKLVKES